MTLRWFTHHTRDYSSCEGEVGHCVHKSLLSSRGKTNNYPHLRPVWCWAPVDGESTRARNLNSQWIQEFVVHSRPSWTMLYHRDDLATLVLKFFIPSWCSLAPVSPLNFPFSPSKNIDSLKFRLGGGGRGCEEESPLILRPAVAEHLWLLFQSNLTPHV